MSPEQQAEAVVESVREWTIAAGDTDPLKRAIAEAIRKPQTDWEWQKFGEDEWAFGQKIRGVVREYKGMVYYSEEYKKPCGYIWVARGNELAYAYEQRGMESSLTAAINQVEKAFGIV